MSMFFPGKVRLQRILFCFDLVAEMKRGSPDLPEYKSWVAAALGGQVNPANAIVVVTAGALGKLARSRRARTYLCDPWSPPALLVMLGTQSRYFILPEGRPGGGAWVS